MEKYAFEKNLTVYECTTSSEEYCIYATQKDAEEHFHQLGLYGTVTLDRVVGFNNQIHVFWVLRLDKEVIGYIPLFIDDEEAEDVIYTASEPIRRTTFYHKKGRCFIFFPRADGNIDVRVLVIFARQELVEALCLTQRIKPSEIYLTAMYTVQENYAVSSCWNVVVEEEQKGEILDKCILLPVDLRDSRRLYEVGINTLNPQMVYENGILLANNTYYRMRKGENGKRYLVKIPVHMSSCYAKTSGKPEKKKYKPSFKIYKKGAD